MTKVIPYDNGDRNEAVKSMSALHVNWSSLKLASYGCLILVISVASSGTVHGTEPYLRVYGNDVLAGAGYGPACTTDATDDILAYGAYTGGPGHDTYIGAGSELAAFAPGLIEEFLPGSSVAVSRSALWELSYANNADASKQAPGVLRFGGGYTDIHCADEFPSIAAFAGLPSNPINLTGLASGNYVFFGDVEITGGTIANGTRITIAADGGDVTITGNITYASSSWGGNLTDIPLLKVYADGDLKIDHSVSTITGLYNAGGDGSGEVWTCTDGATILNATPALVDTLADLCNDTRLIVFGMIVGTDVNFYRTIGDVSAGVVGENYNTSGNLAEVIVFPPEIYLALLTEQGPPRINAGEVDAVRTLPPAF